MNSKNADSNTDMPSSRATPVHCLLHWAELQPSKVYFTQPYTDGTVVDYTWGEVANQVRRMAAHLISLDLPAGSHLGILGKNSAHWMMSDLAIWMAGHVTVPLYPTLSADTAEYVLDHSEIKLLFVGKLDGVSDTWNDVKEAIPADLPCISLPMAPSVQGESWMAIVGATEPLEAPALPDQDDLASIIYTSGSTGRPKGAMHSFRGMMQISNEMEAQFGLGSDERFLSYLPLAHALERVVIETVALYLGAHVYFANNLDTFVEDLNRASPTMFVSVPRLWTKFQHGINDKIPPKVQNVLFQIPVVKNLLRDFILKKLGLSDARLAVTGSAPLPVAVLSWYRNLGLDLLEGYGLTENLAYSHINRAGENQAGFVGFPQNGVECRIAADGEVQVKSPGTMLGYYKAPELTAEAFTEDGFLKTGDLGMEDAGGCLKLTGRKKDIFKTAKGKYVAPVPIEQQLGESPLIESVCIGGGVLPQPVGLLMLSEGAQRTLGRGSSRADIEESLTELLKSVNGRLEHHEKLAFLVVLKDPWTMNNGLLTPTMKIRRQAIEDHYADRFEKWREQGQKIVWE